MTSLLVHLSGCQNHRCAYCGVEMELIQLDRGPRKPRRNKPPQGKSWGAYQRSKKYRRATRDHFIPLGFGGPDTEDNMIAACWWCNSYRGNQPAEVALERIQRLVKRGTHPHIAFERDGHMPKFNMLRTVPPAPREPSFSPSPRTDQPSEASAP
jgi:5-methylcytosine-specific restriction endonuclease McrA